jgi:uncharacterized cupredoxin-like copper-binding protein
MKKTISMLILGVLPALVLAGGNHDGGHDMNDGQSVEQMEHHEMEGMARGAHEAEANASQAGDSAGVSRAIEVTMDDSMRFDPAEMAFKAGETVRFVVRNDGRIRHEMVIGSLAELKEHAEMMRKMPGMQHAESNMVSLAPGESGDLVWQFDHAGSFDFACLVPGHLEAGMTGKIEVE